jgi:hypothetical protein
MSDVKSELEQIPGIGRTIAKNLGRIGVARISDLAGRDPEELYEEWCVEAVRPSDTDRCVLYVLRGAVYYANGGRDPEKLKWWNWKESGGENT